eukprot:jgi/Bigna1/133887/aug1.23_g8595
MGVHLGWKIVAIDGRRVTNDKACFKLLQEVHRISNTVQITFDDNRATSMRTSINSNTSSSLVGISLTKGSSLNGLPLDSRSIRLEGERTSSPRTALFRHSDASQLSSPKGLIVSDFDQKDGLSL